MTRISTSNHDKPHALYYKDWVRHCISRVVPPVISSALIPHVHEDESEHEEFSPSIDLLNGIRRFLEVSKALTWSHKSAESWGYFLALVHWRQRAGTGNWATLGCEALKEDAYSVPPHARCTRTARYNVPTLSSGDE